MATKKTTALVKWDEQLAKEAEIAAGMEANAGGGQFFSLKGGQLCWQDAPLPGNQMAVVILDTILENVFYGTKYDPDNPQGPVCFAFGRDEKVLAPHAVVTEPQHPTCEGCPMNEWASAETGRGKACRNTRRLGMIPAGMFDAAGKFLPISDPEHYASTAVGFMKLPVTSVKGYASFVKQVAGALHRPPHGIATRVRVVPDQKSQFKVVFEPLVSLNDDLMPAVMKRHAEVMTTIDFPYQPPEEAAAPMKRGSRAVTKPAGKRKY